MKLVQIALATMLCAASATAHAQNTRYNELKGTTDAILALMEAENTKSDFCKGYVGRAVTFTSFVALTRNLPNASGKGEYETTPQYDARMASALSWKAASPSILPIPIDRAYVEYNADLEVMIVKATAFKAGRYSDAEGANAFYPPNTVNGGARASYGVSTTKLVRSYTATTRAGIQFRTSLYERRTDALHLTNTRFFGEMKRLERPVMLFEAPLARAPQMRGSIKLAVVVEQRYPFLFHGLSGPFSATLSQANTYNDDTTVAVVGAKCGLVLDAQNRVLASADISE